MRFVIEERILTDDAGKPVAGGPSEPSFHTFDAEDADAAVRLFIRKDGGVLVGEVMKFPGLHAVATVRKNSGVYTLQVSPTSEARFRP